MPKALTGVREARARILASLAQIEAENIDIENACGRVLAEPVFALRASPPGPVSAMDGYALAAASIASIPIELRVSQMIAAGQPAKPLTPGTAARIFTGALVPEGADCIVPQEATEPTIDGRVRIKEGPRAGANLRAAGSDFPAGQAGPHEGRTLSPRDIGLAAAMNHPTLYVRRKPRVALLATGDELVPPGIEPAAHQILASSGAALGAAARLWGAEVVDLGIAPDNEGAIIETVRKAPRCDLLVTLGGASVGEHDLVQRALARMGFKLDFWRVAIKPGKPLFHGVLGAIPVLGLPGNPVSTMICALLFVRPALRTMLGCRDRSGHPDIELPARTALLAADLPANGPREDYLRGELEASGSGLPRAAAFERQDSAHQHLLAQADCLIPRTPFAPASKAGEPHTIIPLCGLF